MSIDKEFFQDKFLENVIFNGKFFSKQEYFNCLKDVCYQLSYYHKHNIFLGLDNLENYIFYSQVKCFKILLVFLIIYFYLIKNLRTYCFFFRIFKLWKIKYLPRKYESFWFIYENHSPSFIYVSKNLK